MHSVNNEKEDASSDLDSESNNEPEVEINTRSDALIEYVIAIWFG